LGSIAENRFISWKSAFGNPAVDLSPAPGLSGVIATPWRMDGKFVSDPNGIFLVGLTIRICYEILIKDGFGGPKKQIDICSCVFWHVPDVDQLVFLK
jgi:hypothetical protein